MIPPPPPEEELQEQSTASSSWYSSLRTLKDEVLSSADIVFQTKLTWLLVLGPIAILGEATGSLGEASCFFCAGIALIPCAERCVVCQDFARVSVLLFVLLVLCL